MAQLYPLGREPKLPNKEEEIFSVLECTGLSFKEVTPHRPGVTGTQRGRASLGAPFLPPGPSSLEIDITAGLTAPPEVTAKPAVVTSTPAHDLSLLLIHTRKTA